MTRRDIYRTGPDGEPDYDGYDEIPEEEDDWEWNLFNDSFNW